jgi:HPr kinase/phosphorylase
MHDDALIHGSCVAIGDDGVLLLGVPGTGKSDLVLRLLDAEGAGISGVQRGTRLVADDQVAIHRNDNCLVASAPAPLSGKLEIRGLGIVEVDCLPDAILKLAVRLTPASEIERMPDLANARMDILGIGIPLVLIDPEKASAPARIRAALDVIKAG